MREFLRGDYVVDPTGTYFIFSNRDEYLPGICHVYGVALSPHRDKAIPMHMCIKESSLVHGKEIDIDPSGELAIIRSYINKGQPLLNVVEARSLPYLKKKGSLKHPFPYTL